MCEERRGALARCEAMHELALARAVIDTAERHAAGRRVLLVRLRLGELRQVVPRSLAFSFEHAARGTLCEGAVLEYEAIPAGLACASCGETWSLASATPVPPSSTRGLARPGRARPRVSFRCPACGGADVGIETGGEFEVESIEVEEPACTG